LNRELQIQVLTKLGLSQTQSKVLLVLHDTEGATARDIQRVSGILKQDVYSALSGLSEKGLIEKIIAKPAIFRPIPLNNAVSILHEAKKDESVQLKKQADELFKNWKREQRNEALFPSTNFVMLSPEETNPIGKTNKIGKAVEKASKSVTGLMSFPIFLKRGPTDKEIWIRAAQRGVKIKVMIFGVTDPLKLNAIDPKISENFDLSWTSDTLPATLVVLDNRELFFSLGDGLKSPVLWSMNPTFVHVINDYVETKLKYASACYIPVTNPSKKTVKLAV
jgi:sugar-specific transcriptional regulator TrmB